MVTKAKALYQVKVILEYLPEEEYKLIPQETIDYIEKNYEYDEKFVIDPDTPLENQKIDDKAYELLDKIINAVENTKINSEQVVLKYNTELEEYVQKVKESNDNYNTKIENIRLNNLIELLKRENNKIPKAKELLEEYKDALKQKDNEIEELKRNNQEMYKCIQKLPKIIRKIFIKDFDTKLLN